MSGGDQELIERLRPVVVSLRVDLDTNREAFTDEVRYIMRDPISSQTYAFSTADYQLLMALDGTEPLGDVFSRLVTQKRLSLEDEANFYNFVVDLHRTGLVNLPVPDYKALYQRYVTKRAAGIRRKLTGFLFMQLPLACPDAFLNRTIRYVRFIYSRWFFALWLGLMATVGFVVVNRFEELVDPLSSILDGDGLALMWVCLILLKVCHEFGHAYACKHFGGDVPEMGVFLIVGSPSAYVDASAAWSFPKRRQRLIVSCGGMYVESIIGGIALLFWACTPPSPMHNLAYQVFLLSTAITLAFNANPLMRFDGYFIMSDLLGIPNLRSRAQQQLASAFDHYVLGLPRKAKKVTKKLALTLMTYGVSAAIYKIFLVLGICTLIASKLYWLGIGLATFYVGSTLWGWISKSAKHLIWSKDTAPARVRSLGVASLLFLGVPASATFLEVEKPVIGWGVVGLEAEAMARLGGSGVLAEVALRPGQWVPANNVLAVVENPQIAEDLATTRAELASTRLEYRALQFSDRGEAAKLKEKILHLETREAEAARQLARLELRLEEGVRVLSVEGERHEHEFRPDGSELCRVGRGAWTVRLMLGAEDMTEAAPALDMRVPVRLSHLPKETIEGRVISISKRGSRHIEDAALTQLGGGRIAVSPQDQEAGEAYFLVTVKLETAEDVELPYGMRAAVRLQAHRKPIYVHLRRWVARFVERLKVGQGA